MRSRSADLAHIVVDVIDKAGDVYLQYIKDMKAEQSRLDDVFKRVSEYHQCVVVVKDGIVCPEIYLPANERNEAISERLHRAHLKISEFNDDSDD